MSMNSLLIHLRDEWHVLSYRDRQLMIHLLRTPGDLLFVSQEGKGKVWYTRHTYSHQRYDLSHTHGESK